MCWVCMRTFKQGHDVYAHMTEAHGGNGLEDPLPDDEHGIWGGAVGPADLWLPGVALEDAGDADGNGW